jgi:hypothetical protein
VVAGTQDIKVGSGIAAITVAPLSGTGAGGEAVVGALTWHKESATGTEAQDGDISGLAIGNTITLHWSFAASDANYIQAAKTGAVTLTVVEGDPQPLVFETPSAVAKTYGDAKFTNAASHSPVDPTKGAITYASDRAEVATVDSATGEVTIAGAGTAVITATAAPVAGTWAQGSASYTLTVNPKSIAGMLAITGAPYTYTGSAQSPAYEVKDGEAELVPATDYTVTLPSETDAGSYDLTVTGAGNYTGTATATFTILPKQLENSMLAISGGTYTYTGSAQSPAYTVTDDVTELAKDTDYEETALPSETDAGDYALTVSGIGNYAGRAAATFTIEKAPLAAGDIEADLTSVAYDGTAKPAAVSVKAKTGYGTLTVKYDGDTAAPVDAGSYAVTVDVSGGANCDAAEGIAIGTYTIDQASASGVGQSVNVKAGAANTYAFDLKTMLPPGVDAAQVSVYAAGSATDADVIIDSTSVDGGILSIAVKDSAAAAQTAEIPITFTSANYTISSAAVTVNVTAKTPVDVSGITVTGRAYNGEAIAYGGAAVFTDIIEEEIIDDIEPVFTWTGGEAPSNAGGYTLTVSAAETEDYVFNPQIIAFTITKAPLTLRADDKSMTRGGALPALTFTAAGLVAGEAWDSVKAGDPSLSTEADGAADGSFAIAITGGSLNGAGGANYAIAGRENGTLTVTAPASSGGGGGGGSSPALTAPAADGAVSVSYTQMGGAVTLTLPDAKVAELIEKSSGTASIDLTSVANATSAELPAAALAKLAEAELAVEIKLPQGSVALEAAAAASAAERSGGGSVSVALKTVALSSLNERQREAVGDAPVFDISVASGSAAIKEFGGGLITIALPYTLKEGETASGVVVWHIDELGNIEKLATMYDTRTKTVIFTTSHLSLYAIAYEEPTESDAPWQNPFSDVKAGDWFYGDVEYAVMNGLFNGTGATTFSPNARMTRAMLVTVLHRISGNPANGANTTGFADVPAGQWYSEAVAWAAGAGIAAGIGNNQFAPNAEITRQDLAALLYRYAQLTDDSGQMTEDAGALSGFGDASAASEYARGALAWAVAAGILRGDNANRLNPQGLATRAEAAAMLHRFLAL